MSTLLVVGLSGVAAADCDPALSRSLHGAAQRLGSVQVTKPGQARVFTRDGVEYTAGIVRRMTVQLRLAEEACDRGDDREAAVYLDELAGALHPPR